jgi:hypothetical protein
MNKLIFKTIILFIIFINIINCTNTNIEKMINDLKKEFKYLEYNVYNNVYTQLKDFKNKINEGIIIIIINCLFIFLILIYVNLILIKI